MLHRIHNLLIKVLRTVHGYPTWFHFSVPITLKRLLKIPTEHLSHTNGSLWFLLLTKCVWGMGMLRVVFNTHVQVGNCYSKSTFNMTLIKQEKLMFMLVILYIREYLHVCVFTKLFTGTWVSEDFQFRVSASRNNGKWTALVMCDVIQITQTFFFEHSKVHLLTTWLHCIGTHNMNIVHVLVQCWVRISL